HVRDLALAIQHVDRHEDDAQSDAREKEGEEIAAVREMDAQTVTAREPMGCERVRQPVGSRVDFAERDRAEAIGRVVLEPDALAAADKRQIEEISKLHGPDCSETGVASRCLSIQNEGTRIKRKPLIQRISYRFISLISSFRPFPFDPRSGCLSGEMQTRTARWTLPRPH